MLRAAKTVLGNGADVTIDTSLRNALLKIAGAQCNDGSNSCSSEEENDENEYQVSARNLGFTMEPPEEFFNRDCKRAENLHQVHPRHEAIFWLTSVDLHWQCQTPANYWFTMIVTFIPSSYTYLIRDMARVPLFCQGESLPRRLVRDEEAFTWLNPCFLTHYYYRSQRMAANGSEDDDDECHGMTSTGEPYM